jgi:hypothetical protein
MLDRLATRAHFFRVLVEPATRLDTVEIAVDIKLQKSRRMIRGSARHLRIDTAETQHVDHANRINLVDPILQAFGKKSTARDPLPQRSASSDPHKSRENQHILEIVSRLNPKTRAASRRLFPSTNTNRRTAA